MSQTPSAPSPDAPLPIFNYTDNQWHPQPYAQGPFGGLHGGAVSGLLVGEIEAKAQAEGLGRAVSATVYLVRPAPLSPLTTDIQTVRAGGRLSVYENSLIAGEKLQSKASVYLLQPVSFEGMTEAPHSDFETERGRIEALPQWAFQKEVAPNRFGGLKTFLDAIDVRQDRDMVWVKPLYPLIENTRTPLGTAISIADFSTLFEVVHNERPPAAGWPNADISVHLARDPVGEWVGVKESSQWFANGTGLTESTLHDTAGIFGRSCQSVVLLPIK